MSDYEIESGIPIPPRKSGLRPTIPWAELEIQQSVFIPAKKNETPTTIRHRVNPHNFGRKSSKKFETRWVRHDGKLGLRIWRIK